MNKIKFKFISTWTILWLISLAIAKFGPIHIWQDNQFLTVTSIVISVVAGWAMVIATIRRILKLDEMQQRILMEAMSLTFGFTFVVGIGLGFLSGTSLMTASAGLTSLVVFMVLCYMINILLAVRRYA